VFGTRDEVESVGRTTCREVRQAGPVR
jgi:hypothetical protein